MYIENKYKIRVEGASFFPYILSLIPNLTIVTDWKSDISIAIGWLFWDAYLTIEKL